MVVHVEFKKRIFTCNFTRICIYKIVNEERNAITNAESYEYLCSLREQFCSAKFNYSCSNFPLLLFCNALRKTLRV